MPRHLKHRRLFVLLTVFAAVLSLAPAAQAGLDNWLFNLSNPAPRAINIQTPTLELVTHTMSYSIEQTDGRLNFPGDMNGEVACGPTAVAESMAYLYRYRSHPFPNLKLDGLSATKATLDPGALARQMYTSCKTGRLGTYPISIYNCVKEIFERSGYDSSAVQRMYSPKIDDLRNAISKDHAVILMIGRYTLMDNKWSRNGGHFVGVYGYRYEPLLKDNIRLLVINPALSYPNGGWYVVGDWLSFWRLGSGGAKKPTGLENSLFTVGNGFANSYANIVDEMIEFVPVERSSAVIDLPNQHL